MLVLCKLPSTLLTHSRPPTHGMVNPTVRMGLSSSVKYLWKHIIDIPKLYLINGLNVP